jgi:hypothetical protein
MIVADSINFVRFIRADWKYFISVAVVLNPPATAVRRPYSAGASLPVSAKRSRKSAEGCRQRVRYVSTKGSHGPPLLISRARCADRALRRIISRITLHGSPRHSKRGNFPAPGSLRCNGSIRLTHPYTSRHWEQWGVAKNGRSEKDIDKMREAWWKFVLMRASLCSHSFSRYACSPRPPDLSFQS